jgi:hypothetical protein
LRRRLPRYGALFLQMELQCGTTIDRIG